MRYKKRILGESQLISSLPGKDSRTLVESRGLPIDSTCVYEAEPGKRDIKRREPGITLISSLQTSNYDVIIAFVWTQRHWRRHSKSANS